MNYLTRLKKYLKKNFTINFEDIKKYDIEGALVVWKYNNQTEKNEYNRNGSGISALVILKSEKINIENKNNKIYYTTLPAFIQYSDGGSPILNIKTYEIIKYYEYNDDEAYKDREYNSIKDKLTTVTYTFEKEDNNLIITGFKVN